MDMLKSLKKLKVVILLLIVMFMVAGVIINVFQLISLPLKYIHMRSYRKVNAALVYCYWCSKFHVYCNCVGEP